MRLASCKQISHMCTRIYCACMSDTHCSWCVVDVKPKAPSLSSGSNATMHEHMSITSHFCSLMAKLPLFYPLILSTKHTTTATSTLVPSYTSRGSTGRGWAAAAAGLFAAIFSFLPELALSSCAPHTHLARPFRPYIYIHRPRPTRRPGKVTRA